MARRAEPARIEQARHDATRNRLIGSGVTEETADLWLAAWDAQAARDGVKHDAHDFNAAWTWIADHRRERVRP